jgi:signal transduction histidine kinase
MRHAANGGGQGRRKLRGGGRPPAEPGPDASRQELERARAELRREMAEREELLTMVSHELRTPVTVLTGYSRLLLSEKVGPLNDEQRRFLRECLKSCHRLNHFIGNLLESSRQVHGGLHLDLEEQPLAPVVTGVASFLAPLIEENGLTLELSLDAAAGRACFDAVRVEQVLMNLLANAIKYARRGGRVRVASCSADGARVEVRVEDDGPGVAPEDRERIFEPYVRAGEGRRAGGLGLGLAICKRIVEAHGGTIGVSDRPGGGSVFAFSLPTARPGAA